MLSMYPPSGIHFRNPFLGSNRSSQSTGHYSHDFDFRSSSCSSKVTFVANQPLTPPPEMNSVVPHVQPPQYHYYGERSAAPAKCKYEPLHHGSQSQVQNSKQETHTRPQSPVYQQHPVTFTTNPPSHSQSHNHGQNQRRGSQMNAIAPALQIPRSVNNSQGSITELAAQITCLFWFESSETLEGAEDISASLGVQSLVAEAIPTTGFRKWVTTILSTTQVAQNVIILALLFIYRLKKINPSVRGKPGSEYRLLTVALMLGNKFLDDNTYTNKTWAEVSGISVAEVHIMEVEFLSNMKYHLFTSAEEWAEWQNQLGRFASFFERASRPIPQLPPTLPSPPTSDHASPPYQGVSFPQSHGASFPQSHGAPFPRPHGIFTPNPSPLGLVPDLVSQTSRKRSLENQVEPPAKRIATTYSTPASASLMPRVTLPSLSIPQSQNFLPQLPPLNYSHRSLGPQPSSWAQVPPISAPSSHYTSTPMTSIPHSTTPSVPHSAVQSRHQSPFPASAGVSPTNGHFQPAGQVHLSQLSPSIFLAQRNSPYRPVRGVSTLLVPPPSGAMQQSQNVGREQMHYQPLGRPQERQQGRLPYIDSQWFDGPLSNHWSSYSQLHQHQIQPTSYYGRA